MLNIWSLLNGEVINGIANVSQIYDVALNLRQVSNDELMQELQNQDITYLTKSLEQNQQIIQQNKEIIEKLNILLMQNHLEAKDNVK